MLDIIEVRIHHPPNAPDSDPNDWDDPGNFAIHTPKKRDVLNNDLDTAILTSLSVYSCFLARSRRRSAALSS
jgi:hypothetical protein